MMADNTIDNNSLMDNIPKIGLKESIDNLTVLYSGVAGLNCPRCGGNTFSKRGYYNYRGGCYPRKMCRDCGYVFSIINPEHGVSKARAGRLFNLDTQKSELLIGDALQFGLVVKNEDGSYSKSLIPKSKTGLYRNVPIYRHLIDIVGFDLHRRVFENALKTFADGTISSTSKIKRDILWRRYKEIAIEVFVCEKRCDFSRTCKKDHIEREECSVVKKAREQSRVWRVDIEI